LDTITKIHECKGSLAIIRKTNPHLLDSLLSPTRITTIDSSAHIEGIYIDVHRVEDLLATKALKDRAEKVDTSLPKNQNEQELLGYAEVIDAITEGYSHIPPAPSTVLRVHKDLYAHANLAGVGSYRKKDTQFIQVDGKIQQVSVSPIGAFETPLALGAACDTLINELETHSHHPLVLIPVFIVDFLCIHPFNEGNGRVSRLLTTLLLYREGIDIGRYSSIEKIIEESAETYYATLNSCALGWERNRNSYLPFVEYFLGIVLSAYRSLLENLDVLQEKGFTKADRVRLLFDKDLGKLTKKNVLSACPDISIATVEAALCELVKSGYVTKVGAGRSTAYVKNGAER
jgi:Fic family protein